MATFAWDESYSVCVRQFDEQHQKLFEIINNLAESMQAGKGQDVIRDVVGQLAVYTRTHFHQEEVLMKQTSYPSLAPHREQHSRFMTDVENYKSALDEGRNPDPVTVLNYLKSWLVEHIQKSDKAYSAHMNGQNVH